MADKPVTREEKYLAYLTGDYTGEIPKPITRKEKYLYELCLKGIGGEISPEEIKAAVNEYLEKNPIKPGATTEQARQIEQNKKDVASLKEDLSNKITKFYASNQGKTHIADSDNGKIQDMMLYGKSEQFTTTGKNLLKIRDMTQITRGITVTAKDGVVALKGTAAETGWAILNIDSFALNGTYILSSNISANVKVVAINKSYKAVLMQNKSAALENVEVCSVCFTVTEGKTYDISNILIQIEKGSVVTSYEPYTGGQPSPSPDYPQEIKSVVNPVVKLTNEDGLKVQSVTLNNITLDAIPVSSGGNVTIDGQQYIADYVDVERGKIVKCVEKYRIPSGLKWLYEPLENDRFGAYGLNININPNFGRNTLFTHYQNKPNGTGGFIAPGNIRLHNFQGFTDVTNFKEWLDKNESYAYFAKNTLEEIDLTIEEIQIFKALSTYYPATNISVNSEQLDGYTVFNYPISMANGWNYVKKQLNDNRDYIYDMDIQSAEAYVNSEYAVALTELEV